MLLPSSPRELYNLVCGLEPVRTRLDRGSQSTLTLLGDGWLLKEDAPGAPPQVEWEWRVYALLQDLGLDYLAPEADLSGPELVLRLVNAAASLEDYAVAFCTKGYPTALWVDICTKVGRVISKFHRAGFVHGDLHCGNVLISLERRGQFRAYLVDFGLTQHPELGEYPHRLTVEPSEEADLDRLDESLRLISQDREFLKGLVALACAAND